MSEQPRLEVCRGVLSRGLLRLVGAAVQPLHVLLAHRGDHQQRVEFTAAAAHVADGPDQFDTAVGRGGDRKEQHGRTRPLEAAQVPAPAAVVVPQVLAQCQHAQPQVEVVVRLESLGDVVGTGRDRLPRTHRAQQRDLGRVPRPDIRGAQEGRGHEPAALPAQPQKDRRTPRQNVVENRQQEQESDAGRHRHVPAAAGEERGDHGHQARGEGVRHVEQGQTPVPALRGLRSPALFGQLVQQLLACGFRAFPAAWDSRPGGVGFVGRVHRVYRVLDGVHQPQPRKRVAPVDRAWAAPPRRIAQFPHQGRGLLRLRLTIRAVRRQRAARTVRLLPRVQLPHEISDGAVAPGLLGVQDEHGHGRIARTEVLDEDLQLIVDVQTGLGHRPAAMAPRAHRQPPELTIHRGQPPFTSCDLRG
ncbi:hypothetical protein [Streptomyces sp. bgisy027]|uniref:hypothetical protein n=1 Tax=Streptomyces sp. bgisy027 TaxID=3413770 RepID=UPI003D755738